MSQDRFGRYEVRGALGDGSMARVYRAWDPAFERTVAIKTVKSEYLASDTAPRYLQRFGQEARAAGSLSHPNIVRVFDVGADFMVMEFVEGRTLRDLLRGGRRFDPEETVALLSPIADALDHAHRAGIIHRDVKPANIMVQPHGVPKLMDFGIAHIDGCLMTSSGEILGTPAYMAPEQVVGQQVAHQLDLYALAAVAFEMLTGRPLFQGAVAEVVYRVVHETWPPPRQLDPGLPACYDNIFLRALHKDPNQRFATAAQFVAALDLRRFDRALASMLPERMPLRPRRRGSWWRGGAKTFLPRRLPASHPGEAPRRRSRTLTTAVGLGALLAVTSSTAGRAAREPSRLLGVAPAASLVRDTPKTRMRETADAPRQRPPTRPRTAGRPVRAGQVVAGQVVAGQVVAGQVVAGQVVAGQVVAGQIVAGQVVDPGPDVQPQKRIAGSVVSPDPEGRGPRTGTVAIRMIVDENGVPGDFTVLESAGPRLDAAALASVQGWRFAPARKDGVSVKVRWVAHLRYETR